MDNVLSRTEVMAILRSVGNDSVVISTELNDLRTLVNSTQYVMPAHVRGLARNTVTVNPANLRFQRQTAVNLVAGSSSTLLNRLVDKWFLGVDAPSMTVASLSYTAAAGRRFNTVPSNLVASHAYSITGYSSSTGRFTLYHSWGNTHPNPLMWSELQTHSSMFTTTDPRGSDGDGSGAAGPVWMAPLRLRAVKLRTGKDKFRDRGWS